MKAIVLGAIGVVAMLMWLRDEPPPRAPAPPKAAAPAKVAAAKPPAAAPKPASPAKKPAAAPKPQPLVVKVIPPVETLPELIPVAAADPAPRNDPPRSDPPRNDPPRSDPPPANDPPPVDPNSVFGWGPWTGGEPSTPAGGAPAAGGNAPPRVDGLTPTLTAASPGAPAGSAPPVVPPPVVPPPQGTGSVRPGHGFGDRNHTHIHRR